MEKGLSLTATDILCKQNEAVDLLSLSLIEKICQPLIRNNTEKWPQSPTHTRWKKKGRGLRMTSQLHACLCGDIARCLPVGKPCKQNMFGAGVPFPDWPLLKRYGSHAKPYLGINLSTLFHRTTTRAINKKSNTVANFWIILYPYRTIQNRP